MLVVYIVGARGSHAEYFYTLCQTLRPWNLGEINMQHGKQTDNGHASFASSNSPSDTDLSSRSRVLTRPELLGQIFGILAPSEDLSSDPPPTPNTSRGDDRATLASCARVCRAFHDLAIDALWATLDRTEPLLSLFTVDKLGNRHLPVGDVDAEWNVFKRYASRVRNLRLTGSNVGRSCIWIMLSSKSCGAPLLPNLRKLVAVKMAASDVAPVILLLASPIRELCLSFGTLKGQEDEPPSDDVLSRLVTVVFNEVVKGSPKELTHLSLLARFPLPAGCIPALAQCSSLQSLQLPEYTLLDGKHLRGLATLQSLRSISLAVGLGECTAAADTNVGTVWGQLNELCLTASPSDAATFVAAARPQALTTFHLTVPDPVTLNSLQECLGELVSHLPQSIRDLQLGIRNPPPTSEWTLSDVVHPFFGLRGLEEFACDLGACLPHLTDEDLAQVARAWPGLSRLDLLGSVKPRQESLAGLRRPTVHALAAFLRGCPGLRDLALPGLDTASFPPVHAVPVLDSALERFTLAYLPATGAAGRFDFAVVVDRVCPRLEKLTLLCAGHVEGGRGVVRFLQAMRAGREHGRIRLAQAATEGVVAPERSVPPLGDEPAER
ncbi:hypothetical protein C8Q77DRAFT_146817 [Trametes polyzona]|nr:hypothetical protein C8Q77DRAFT_146817 [Trametes polyzona]